MDICNFAAWCVWRRAIPVDCPILVVVPDIACYHASGWNAAVFGAPSRVSNRLLILVMWNPTEPVHSIDRDAVGRYLCVLQHEAVAAQRTMASLVPVGMLPYARQARQGLLASGWRLQRTRSSRISASAGYVIKSSKEAQKSGGSSAVKTTRAVFIYSTSDRGGGEEAGPGS